MEKNIHAEHRKRMRNKLVSQGFKGFPEHEVLEMLLYGIYTRRDTNPIAHALIEEFGGFYGVFNAPAERLMAVDGVGESAAQYIKMLREFVRYYIEKRMSLEKFDIDKKATQDFLHELFADETRELSYVICLNSQNKVIRYKMISEGDFDKVDVNINLIAKTAIECGAPYVVMTHNHPSGSIIASYDDYEATKHLDKALKILGIKLIDHFVITDDCISSIYGKEKIFSRNLEKSTK